MTSRAATPESGGRTAPPHSFCFAARVRFLSPRCHGSGGNQAAVSRAVRLNNAGRPGAGAAPHRRRGMPARPPRPMASRSIGMLQSRARGRVGRGAGRAGFTAFGRSRARRARKIRAAWEPIPEE